MTANVSIYTEQGGAKQVLGSGAELELQSGSTFDVQSGTTVTCAAKINLTAASGAASASGLLFGRGTSADPALTSTADTNFTEIRAKSTATSGTARLDYRRFDLGGAGASGECLRAFTDLTAAVATAHGAHISVQAGATGYVTGQAVGVRSQLYVKNEAVHAAGTYYGGQSEVWFAGSSGSLAAVTAHAIHSFISAGDSTGKATCLNVWDVQATAAADTTKAVSSVSLAELPSGTVGIACTINGTRYYIPAVVDTAWN
jgi:hypothetical protein